MNKGDLINQIAKVVCTKKEAQEVVGRWKRRTRSHWLVSEPYKVAQRKARKARNPQTGAEIKIKAKKVAKFVPGKALKDAVG